MTEPGDAIADHQRGIAVLRDVVRSVHAEHLPLVTPCADWLVGDVLAHQLGQDLAFTRALRGGASAVSDWAGVPVGADVPAPLLGALAAQEQALREFSGSGRSTIWMPEIIADRPLSADRALAAHLVDLLVHAWDIGVSVGRPPHVEDDLARFCLRVAESIPDTPETRGPGRAFRPAVPAVGDASPFDRALRLLGRDPAWSPPRSRASL